MSTVPRFRRQSSTRPALKKALLAAFYDAVAQDFEEANAMAGFQIGRAIVSSGANGNSACKRYVGKAATGRYNACNHPGCTEAKNRAMNNLLNSRGLRDNPQCSKYITATQPCQKFHC